MKHGGHFQHQEQAPTPPEPDYLPRNVDLEQTGEEEATATWECVDEPFGWKVQSRYDENDWGSDIDDFIAGANRSWVWATHADPGAILWFRICAADEEETPLSAWVEASVEWA